MYAYCRSGRRDRASDFDLPDDIGPVGIDYDDDRFYVAAYDLESGRSHKVYAFPRTVRCDSASDFGISDKPSVPLGITSASGRIYVVFDRMYGDITTVEEYSVDGKRDLTFDFDLSDVVEEDAYLVGIRYASGRLYAVVVSDASGLSPVTRKTYAYSLSGQRDAGSDLVLDVDNRNAFGIAYADVRFYVVDSRYKRVYVYEGRAEASRLRDAATTMVTGEKLRKALPCLR